MRPDKTCGNILIISSKQKIVSEHQTYLHSLLGQYLVFNTLVSDKITDPSQFKDYQCLLFITQNEKDRFPFHLDESILQIVCTRTFNHTYLSKIIQLPPHERVYLVNDEKDSTLAIISQLKECGLTQYEFVPFYPGCEDTESDITFAVTAGEPQLVPKRIQNVLDIGNRIVDISTILELCEYFHIPRLAVNRVTRSYINQILRTIKTTDTYYTNFLQTRHLMRSVLSSLPTGICLYGCDGRISFMNMRFAQILDLPSNNFQGQPFSDCLPKCCSDIALNRNGEWDIPLANGRNTVRMNILNLMSPVDSPMFLAFFPEQNSVSIRMEIDENRKPEEPAQLTHYFFSLFTSPEIKRLTNQAKHLALYDFPVLIFGQSGTMRLTLARMIHSCSKRYSYPFTVLHSPGSDLTESALRKILEETNHGTLVLSQADRFPPEVQDLLTNILMNTYGNFFSAPESYRYDVRIISIADENLYEKVENGTFLRDLFCFLSASEIHTVSLQEIRNDIPLLLDHFLRQLFQDSDISAENILSASLLDFMKHYRYPGNLRELYNLSCCFYTKFSGHQLVLSDLPFYLRKQYRMQTPALTDLQTAVLRYLSSHPKAGRNTIRHGLSESDIFVSDASLRNVLSQLAENGFLIVHRTKGGCEITESGKLVIGQ